jgi:hypothetical protein
LFWFAGALEGAVFGGMRWFGGGLGPSLGMLMHPQLFKHRLKKYQANIA